MSSGWLQRGAVLVDVVFMRKQRSGGSTRAIAFERRLAFLHRNRFRLFVLAGGYWLLFGLVGVFFIPPIGWFSGVYWGGASVGFLWTVSWFATLDGTLFIRAGSWAEEWSSEALRKKLRGFTVIDDFPFEGRNLDHVVVGPGGVYVVETKWRSTWKNRALDLKELTLERRQALYQAEDLQEILLSLGHAERVRPVVVAWGPGIPTEETVVQFGRIPVFVGDRWKDWPDRPFARDDLAPKQVLAIAESLTSFVKKHSPRYQMSLPRRSVRIARALLTPTLHR